MSESYCLLIGADVRARHAIHAVRLAETGLHPVFEAAGIRLSGSASLPITLIPGAGGVVIGRIFARDDHSRTAEMLDRLPGRRDGAAFVIEHLWGRYLAVLTGDAPKAIDILRDPVGLIPCFSASKDGITAFASDARILLNLGLFSGTIDWSATGRPLAYQDLRLERTNLAGVSDPTPGQVITMRPSGVETKTLWHPSRFCRRAEDWDFAAAAQAVRDTVDEIMSAWSSTADKILLSLSGGLDSSIIAASVSTPQSRLALFNLRSGQGRGDERDYARVMANDIGVDLEEHDISRSPVDLGISLACDLPNASARCFTQPADRFARELADRVGANIHMNGGGGDNVFAYLHSANPAADRLRARGPGIGFFQTTRDLAELTDCTLPHVGWRAIRKAWLTPDRYRWPRHDALLTTDFLSSLGPARHPWLADEAKLRPGQREHLAVIARASFYVHHLNIGDDRPTIFPLLSQPLVELCLSIPSWFSCMGGRDRAVARAAFADHVPQAILERRTKGAFDGVLLGLYERNRTRIREIVLDGRLVREGIVSKAAAEQALQARLATGSEASRLIQFVDVEAWASAWAG